MVTSAVLLLSLCPPVPLSPAFGQVGHEPQASPFRDITTTQGFSLFFGRFAGAQTVAGVGARPGAFVGLRLESRLAGPLDLAVTYGQAYSSRFQVVPSDTVDRVRGPVDQTLIAADLAIMLNLTGAKRWHAFAPYAGLGFGVIQTATKLVDPGGFQVGSNFILAPTIGTRIFVGRALAVRLEARDYWLRYEWPLSYYTPVDSANNPVTPVLHPSVSTRQVTHNFTLTAGLSYLFTF
jgi:hypothetical protein